MAATIPTREPLEFTQGTTVAWTKSLADYPPATWTLSYAFSLLAATSAQKTVTATDNGDGTHLVTITAASSAAYGIGAYRWQSRVTDGTSVYQIAEGTVEVSPDLSAAGYASTGYDDRSIAKKALDAIESVLAGRAAEDYDGYSMPDGRSLSKMTLAEMITARSKLKVEVSQEEAARRVGLGLGNPNKFHVRFTGRR